MMNRHGRCRGVMWSLFRQTSQRFAWPFPTVAQLVVIRGTPVFPSLALEASLSF